MFVHIGGTTVIQAKEIIAIFSIDIQTTSPVTNEFLNRAKKDGQVDIIDTDETKSVVITENRVYYSPISSLTLRRRADESHHNQVGEPI